MCTPGRGLPAVALGTPAQAGLCAALHPVEDRPGHPQEAKGCGGCRCSPAGARGPPIWRHPNSGCSSWVQGRAKLVLQGVCVSRRDQHCSFRGWMSFTAQVCQSRSQRGPAGRTWGGLAQLASSPGRHLQALAAATVAWTRDPHLAISSWNRPPRSSHESFLTLGPRPAANPYL